MDPQQDRHMLRSNLLLAGANSPEEVQLQKLVQ
jgi:hypothetical protein